MPESWHSLWHPQARNTPGNQGYSSHRYENRGYGQDYGNGHGQAQRPTYSGYRHVQAPRPTYYEGHGDRNYGYSHVQAQRPTYSGGYDGRNSTHEIPQTHTRTTVVTHTRYVRRRYW